MSLDFDVLTNTLSEQQPDLLFYGLDRVNSTNSYLKKYCKTHKLALCVTNDQYEGYGQRKRIWASNLDSLKMSLLIKLSLPVIESDGLSQYLGLRICSLINTVGSREVKIKWPNDLFSVNGKVGGLLIETCSISNDEVTYIVGLGVNLSPLDNIANNEYEADFVDLKISKESFLLLLSQTIIDACRCFSSYNNDDLPSLFRKYDYFSQGQKVFVYHNERKIVAKYVGLTSRGEVVVSFNNKYKYYRSGSVSIRAAK